MRLLRLRHERNVPESRGDKAGFYCLLSVTYYKKTKLGKSGWVCKQRREQRETRNVGLAKCQKSPCFQPANHKRGQEWL